MRDGAYARSLAMARASRTDQIADPLYNGADMHMMAPSLVRRVIANIPQEYMFAIDATPWQGGAELEFVKVGTSARGAHECRGGGRQPAGQDHQNLPPHSGGAGSCGDRGSGPHSSSPASQWKACACIPQAVPKLAVVWLSRLLGAPQLGWRRELERLELLRNGHCGYLPLLRESGSTARAHSPPHGSWSCQTEH